MKNQADSWHKFAPAVCDIKFALSNFESQTSHDNADKCTVHFISGLCSFLIFVPCAVRSVDE